MAFRRFRSFKRGSGSSRFRSRRPLGRTVTRNKLEVGTFFIEQESLLPNSSAAETLQYFHLASIATSLASGGTGAQAAIGTTLAAMQRRLVIHGIVMDWGWKKVGAYTGDNGSAMQNGFVHCQTGLLVDRQVSDTLVVSPASIGSWSPWTSTFPTGLLSSTTPSSTTDPVAQPQRVLFRKTHLMSMFPAQIANANENLQVPDGQSLNQNFSTINRRLRISLDDEQGLYIYAATRNSPTFDVDNGGSRGLTKWFAGAIYYRFQQ